MLESLNTGESIIQFFRWRSAEVQRWILKFVGQFYVYLVSSEAHPNTDFNSHYNSQKAKWFYISMVQPSSAFAGILHVSQNVISCIQG